VKKPIALLPLSAQSAEIFSTPARPWSFVNSRKIHEFRCQTLTFAVLSQTMGVVTCGTEMKPGPFLPDRISKRVPKGFFGEKMNFYETYISTTSTSQKISPWFS
jgi:hypothetical protein